MEHSSTTAFWAGDDGYDYTVRNRVDWTKRIPFWSDVLDRTNARSVYETGCNAGWNLSAILRIDPEIQCYGHDLNELAVRQANAAGLFNVQQGATAAASRMDWSQMPATKNEVWPDDTYDLSFTAGVLIHIEPARLEAFMGQVERVSAQYILAIEYAADQEVEIEYRGQMGLLWKRPYGRLYEALGLKLVDTWHAGEGFDNCHAWLLEKP